MPASLRRSARACVPTAFMRDEPMPTADMTHDERAAVTELRHVFRLKRKLPAFDEQHFLQLDRLAKIARTAAVSSRVAALRKARRCGSEKDSGLAGARSKTDAHAGRRERLQRQAHLRRRLPWMIWYMP